MHWGGRHHCIVVVSKVDSLNTTDSEIKFVHHVVSSKQMHIDLDVEILN
jgi:hypothetical protein